MHGDSRIRTTIPRAAVRVSNRASAASGGRPRSQARAGCIPAHGEFGVIRAVRPDLVMIKLVLVGVWNIGHVLHVCELAVRGASMTEGTALGLNRPLSIDFFVPALHGLFILVTDDEVVDNTRVTLPEDLDAIHAWPCGQNCLLTHLRMTGMQLTRLLKAHNIRDIRHVDPTLQLKTGLAFRPETRLVFVHHELRLLLVGVDVFAAQKNALKQEDVVLETCCQRKPVGTPREMEE